MLKLKLSPALEEFNPTPDYLLCEQATEKDRSGSIIIIPDSAKVPLTQGVVLKAGSACNPELYSPGRVVIFRLHTEDRVSIGGVPYLVIDPANVILTGPIVDV
jgi:co-chaperonin GroES (HSP10)